MFHWIYICSSGLYQKAFHNGKTIIKIQYIWESAIKSALQKHPQINPGSLGLWYLRTSTLICFRQLGLSPSARVMCSYSIWWDMALPTHWAFRGNLLIPSPGSGERRKFCKDLGLLEDKIGERAELEGTILDYLNLRIPWPRRMGAASYCQGSSAFPKDEEEATPFPWTFLGRFCSDILPPCSLRSLSGSRCPPHMSTSLGNDAVRLILSHACV